MAPVARRLAALVQPVDHEHVVRQRRSERSRRFIHPLQLRNPVATSPPELWKLTWPRPEQRYYIWKEAQAKAQSAVWTDPRGYYFLNIMVVLPKVQDQGIGRAMMKAVTDQADAEGMSCYLESSRDVPNLDIYGRLGFRFTKELECDDAGNTIKLYTMVREPNAGPQSR